MKIGVIAPGYAMKREQLDAVVARLSAQGHSVRVHPQCYETYMAFSGTDDARYNAFLEYINDATLDAVMTTRAAHGASRFIDRVRPADIAAQGPVFVGFSDQTVLCNFLSDKCGRRSIYGPILRQVFDQVTDAEIAALFTAIADPKQYDLNNLIDARTTVITPGAATGQLVGGNLEVLTKLLGTTNDLNTDGRILFFEELDESLHHVDRCLWHLHNAGKLTKLAGVMVGRMVNCGSEDTDYGTDITGVIREHFADKGYPVIMGAAFGHNTIHGPDAKVQTPKMPVPYLLNVALTAKADGTIGLASV